MHWSQVCGSTLGMIALMSTTYVSEGPGSQEQFQKYEIVQAVHGRQL